MKSPKHQLQDSDGLSLQHYALTPMSVEEPRKLFTLHDSLLVGLRTV